MWAPATIGGAQQCASSRSPRLSCGRAPRIGAGLEASSPRVLWVNLNAVWDRAEVPVPRLGSRCAPWGPPRALPRGCSKPRAGRRRSARATAPRKSNAAVARSTPKRVTALRGHPGGGSLCPPGVPGASPLGGARLAAPFCARHFPHANGDRKRGWAQWDPSGVPALS